MTTEDFLVEVFRAHSRLTVYHMRHDSTECDDDDRRLGLIIKVLSARYGQNSVQIARGYPDETGYEKVLV